jgi:hypothetical protein
MNLLNTILKAGNGQVLQQMATQLGSNPEATQSALSQVVGALGKGVAKSASSGGLEGLVKALGSGSHGRYLDDPSALGQANTIADGNGILGHILGGKDASRTLAGQVAGNSGMSQDQVKKLLPMAAAAMMGALSKGTQGGQALASQLGGGLGAAGKSPALGGLLSMLDADGDGSPVNDVVGLAKRFLKR